ncbi:MAG: shikimate kinase [Verrucomicrobia bacterium]|nr:MAG: shikimate kinase [Verrucomicrobiota bacterium]TAF25829.1 MAG: shikimate kinase [Verrucomicrobiota bacterium]TAF41616.1 MAG: shikimate kinase [Verrucomicrobiota bacterium]
MNSVEDLPRNIVLIGLMGCGKSTIGRKLQTLLGYPLVDTDQLIEEKLGCSIAEVFAQRGEPYFREVESAVLHELSAPGTPRRIIATGGGIVCRRRNRQLLASLGFVVWLQAPVDVILQRTARNRDRPLLETDDRRGRIEKLMAERAPLYREIADLSLETAGLEMEEIACGILESARYHFAAKA